jgi:hypothetical protein
MVKFISDRYFTVNGNTEGEFEPSRQGCYVSVFVEQKIIITGLLFGDEPLAKESYKLICIARFGKYAGQARGLAEAKRWLKAAFAQYATGTELYNALNPGDGEHISPGQLIPVPPPRKYRRRA